MTVLVRRYFSRVFIAYWAVSRFRWSSREEPYVEKPEENAPASAVDMMISIAIDMTISISVNPDSVRRKVFLIFDRFPIICFHFS